MSNCILTHGRGANDEPLHREAEPRMLLCLSHRNRMTRIVADVRDLWVDLAFIVEAGTAPKDETPKTRHLKAAEAPAPANLEVLSLRDPRSSSAQLVGDTSTPIPAVLSIVASWVLLLAEERPLTATLPQSLLAQLNLLIRHHDWIAGREWIDDYLIEFGDLRKALSAALRDHTHEKVGRCRLPAEGREGLCGGVLLRENGSDVVKCRECSAVWASPQEVARLAVSLESA